MATEQKTNTSAPAVKPENDANAAESTAAAVQRASNPAGADRRAEADNKAPATTSTSSDSDSDKSSDVDASSAAADLAEEHGIDLAEVDGTGANGSVVKSDVEKVIAAIALASRATAKSRAAAPKKGDGLKLRIAEGRSLRIPKEEMRGDTLVVTGTEIIKRGDDREKELSSVLNRAKIDVLKSKGVLVEAD